MKGVRNLVKTWSCCVLLCALFLTSVFTVILLSTRGESILVPVDSSSSLRQEVANGSLCPCIYSTEVQDVTLPMFSRISEPLHSLEPPDSHRRPRGYLIALRHYEQQTQAMRNYLQLQCFAHSLGLRVVEPFLQKSFLVFPMDRVMLGEDVMQYGDLIDLGLWNRETVEKFGYSPVAKWDEFLRTASPNVIVICMKHRSPPHIKVPIPGFNYATGCSRGCFDRFNSSLALLRKHNPGSKLVHQACANFVEYAGTVSIDSFTENMMGKYVNEDVTILMSEFRGFFGLYRVPVLSHCGIKHFKTHDINIVPSAKIMKDAENYISNVLSNQPYVAILVRVERIILHLHHNMSSCAWNLVQRLKKLQTTYGINKYFVGIDVGKYGSQGAERKNLFPYGMIVFDAVYRKKWTFQEWEDSFERYASRNESGYIANFQRAIAAKANCLIIMGGGGFQGQARELYEKFHPDPASQCIHKVCCAW